MSIGINVCMVKQDIKMLYIYMLVIFVSTNRLIKIKYNLVVLTQAIYIELYVTVCQIEINFGLSFL